jgi:hypothetical protein
LVIDLHANSIYLNITFPHEKSCTLCCCHHYFFGDQLFDFRLDSWPLQASFVGAGLESLLYRDLGFMYYFCFWGLSIDDPRELIGVKFCMLMCQSMILQVYQIVPSEVLIGVKSGLFRVKMG